MKHEQPPRWTPEAQARFIALWEQGLMTADIAHSLGLTRTTVQRRARCLQRRGLIQPRPRRSTSHLRWALAQVMTFLIEWAEEPDVNEVFVAQLRYLVAAAHHSHHTALEQARRRHERN